MKNQKLNYLIKTSLLGVIAFLIMFLETPIMFFPEFLKIDLSDIPAIIAGFSLGPIFGVLVELIKNLLHLLRTSTFGVGELANFLVGIALVVPASIIYHRNKSKKNAIIGLGVGTLVMALMGGIANIYILIPAYSKLMGYPLEAIIAWASQVNSLIVDLNSYILYAIIPFNIIKGIVVSIITLVIYKKISKILH